MTPHITIRPPDGMSIVYSRLVSTDEVSSNWVSQRTHEHQESVSSLQQDYFSFAIFSGSNGSIMMPNSFAAIRNAAKKIRVRAFKYSARRWGY